MERFQNDKADYINLVQSGAAITYKLAEILGVGIGDEISWHLYGDDEWKTVRITLLYRSPIDQGLSMTRKAYESLGFTFKATSILSAMEVDPNLKTDNIDVVHSKTAIVKNFKEQMGFVDTIIGILVLGAVLLGVIMIYNIGVISITEKTGEISVLKVLGFKDSGIRKTLQQQNLWITAAGILLGIPAGLSLVNIILNSAGEQFDMRVLITPLSWLICILGTFTLSVLVNLMLSRKVKTIDMVGSLKGME
jgi:putative ABC transport system permease protein